MAKRAIFFDRDGTLIHDVGYLSTLSSIKLLPGVPQALQKLTRLGYHFYVVTNQSGVARGIIDADFVTYANAAVAQQLQPFGIFIQGWLVCPHMPKDECQCRKPRLGLLQKIVDVDLSTSWMLGDKLSDAQFGINAGMRSILVNPNGVPGVLYTTVANMHDAAEVICANEADS
jgi:D-glycero-D-manno-heptose 1,7-bisphosphate phosphatase